MSSPLTIPEREQWHQKPQAPCRFCGAVPESVYLKGVRCVATQSCPIHKRVFRYDQWNRR